MVSLQYSSYLTYDLIIIKSHDPFSNVKIRERNTGLRLMGDIQYYP